MLHGSFYSDNTNQTIRDWMFYEAHKIFPAGRMFVNEFEVLSAPWFTQSYVEQIRQFQKKGIHIDGIGVQGHFAGHVHPEILKVFILKHLIFLLDKMFLVESSRHFIILL